jgi:hypothetical protein
VKALINEWGHRNLVALEAHYDAARFFSRRNYWIGIPAIVFAAVVGTSVFATLEKEVDVYIKLIVAMISIFAAVLSALQTFLKYSDRADSHRRTGARYAAIKREIEQLLTSSEEKLKEDAKPIDVLRKKIDELSFEAPELPAHILKAAREKHPLLTESEKT